jgi:PEP-CTERM motif
MSSRRKSLSYFTLLCLFTVLVGLVPSVSATPVTLNITNANCGLNCSLVPQSTVIGTVSMNLNVTGSVTVTVLLNPQFTFIVPDGNDINFNGLGTSSTDTISNFNQSLTGAPGTFTTPLVFSSLNGGTNVGSGFGVMSVTMFQVQDPFKPQQPLDYVQFTIASTSAFTAANLANALFAFHLGTCPQPNKGCNATTTGFVGTGTTGVTPVPEPSTGGLAIFGGSLLLAGTLLRRRFRLTATA